MPYSKNVNNLRVCIVCKKSFYRQRRLQECCSKKCSLVIIHKRAVRYENEEERKKAQNRFKKNYALKNKEKIDARNKKYREENREIINAKAKIRNATPEAKLKKSLYQRKFRQTPAYKAMRSKYKRSDKGRLTSRIDASRRRKFVKQQTPKWEDPKKTAEIFRIAIKIEKILNKHLAKHNQPPIKYNVDHVIPLKGQTFEEGAPVSGLNVWYNLMPILHEDNVKKQKLCPPMTSINNKTPQLTLDKLPPPKEWMRFIRVMYANALKASKDNRHYEKIIKNYIEVNPRNLKNN